MNSNNNQSFASVASTATDKKQKYVPQKYVPKKTTTEKDEVNETTHKQPRENKTRENNTRENKNWFNVDELQTLGKVQRQKPRFNKDQVSAYKQAVLKFTQNFLLPTNYLVEEIESATKEMTTRGPKKGLQFKPYYINSHGDTVEVEVNDTKYEFSVLGKFENGQCVEKGLFKSKDFWQVLNEYYNPHGIRVFLKEIELRNYEDNNESMNKHSDDPNNWKIVGYLYLTNH